MNRRKILVLSHLYPRHDKDYISPFLGTLAEHLSDNCDIIVLAPWHQNAVPERAGVKLRYFRYFFKSLEYYSYTGSLYARIRGFKPHYLFLAVCFFIAYFFRALYLTIQEDPDIIHCHWFVPSGIVGYLISIVTGKPLLVTVYSDGFLIAKSKPLKLLAKIIFRRAKSVIAISKAIRDDVAIACPPGKIEVIYPCTRVF